MYAVVETGGKQYRVAVGDKLKVEKLDAEEGTNIELDRVLMVCDSDNVEVGTPLLEGTAVGAKVLVQGRGDKIKVFKFKRRKKYRRTQGHRQSFTQLQITSIGGVTAEPEKAKADKTTEKEKLSEVKKETDVKEAAPKKVKADKKPSAKKAATKKDKVSKKAKKASSDGDKLSTINGIGPVIEEKLNALGVTTFQQIADFTDEQAEEVDGKLNFKGRIEREEWIAQAKKLVS